ncbi:MAG: 50S ribosomal protein L31e [Candidatus Bathyarchaeota archaeon]|nr:50S ribosomal protein L31e [Candidatus Bathyarchaeota archaeon]
MSESEPVEERIYTVPLGRAWVAPRYRRAEKAISVLRAFVERHMKPASIVIDPKVNEAIWKRGIQNPPRKIRVRLSRDEDGTVTVALAEEARP